MKTTLTSILLIISAVSAFAQTKVFKEVSEDISSEIKTIRQDNALVGYVVFTQLEKASEDSFNYKITIMDENLNDIGTINFRDIKLFLQSASFEQDVLCLAYVKSNFIGKEFRNLRQIRAEVPKAKHSVFMQFLNLDGKVIKTQDIPIDIEIRSDFGNTSRFVGLGEIKHPLQLHNVAGRGFACFYGDDRKNNLRIYDAQGNQVWHKIVTETDAQAFGLLTSKENVYLLVKKKDRMLEGGFEVLGYRTTDSSTFPKVTLKDKQGNPLKVITFANDPASGLPYLSGTIIHPTKGNKYELAKHLSQGAYMGVFTINLNGPKKADIKETYSYWNDGSASFMSKKGYCEETGGFPRFYESFKDFEGNTYYAGSSISKKLRAGAIVGTVATLPLLLPPIFIASAGYTKFNMTDAVLVKQNAKGTLTLEKSIPANSTKFNPSVLPISYANNRSFYNVINSDTKTGYVIVDDARDIHIYNVNQKKVVRTIPHKDGNVSTYVFPAKEGHVMVSEYNKKEKYTRFSIEAL